MIRSPILAFLFLGAVTHVESASVVIPSGAAGRIVQGTSLSDASVSGGNTYYIDYSEIAPVIWFVRSGRYDLRNIPKLLDPSVSSYKVNYVVIGGGGGGAYGCVPGGAGGFSSLRFQTLNVVARGGAGGQGDAQLKTGWYDFPDGSAFVGIDGDHGVRGTQSSTSGSASLPFPVRTSVVVADHGVMPYQYTNTVHGLARGDGGRGFGAGGGGVLGGCGWAGLGGKAGSVSTGQFVYDQGVITVTVGAGGAGGFGSSSYYGGRGAYGAVGLRFVPR